MLVLSGFLIFITLQSVFCGSLSDEFSVGTNMNKYLYSPKSDADEFSKRDNEKPRSEQPIWFGPRYGKRSQSNDVPQEIIEFFEKIDKSPELQKLLIEKFQLDEFPYISFIPHMQQRSRPFTPRYGRDAPDATQNLNSRPYPPRFGRTLTNLPPYLPRLGRSSD